MSSKKLVAASLLAMALTALVGCVQYPTERQSVVDLRPQISFRFDPADTRMAQARVLVNGLDSGRMADFLDGTGSLRVLSGTHIVQVISGSEVLLNERAYVGDGVARPFTVK
ncbi:MAG: hypothetical protein A3E79_04970 [Burkholderiales bacterium RIFCSPHIGHO2_12_FULL_61_11]|nr:MAG: hypothetical protein A3E79_04970 [Burkholderiales bacterium RIFCSPHIGHO2_12_FULL_61_11]